MLNQKMKSKPVFNNFDSNLQELLRFDDGKPVLTHDDWRRRRTELIKPLQDICYGPMPPPPEGRPRVVVTKPGKGAFRNAPSATQARLVTFPFEGSDYGILLDLYTPIKAETESTVPVVICGDGCWQRVTPEFAELVTSRGYALCVFDRTTVAPDIGESHEAVRNSILGRRNPQLEFGANCGLAWGFSRVMDAIQEIKGLDASRVAVCGHSRGGKAALLAGAFDERFAAVFPNGSGSGGSGSWLFLSQGAEPLDVITRVFPSWFTPGFADYAHREAELPFDSHLLKALCATRPVVSTEALGEPVGQPRRSSVTHAAARDVYRFLGGSDAPFPMHFPNGGHGTWNTDWTSHAGLLRLVLLRESPSLGSALHAFCAIVCRRCIRAGRRPICPRTTSCATSPDS